MRGISFAKLCALLSGLSLLRDLLHCLLYGLLCSLLDYLSFLCGHGGCELEMIIYKSTRSCAKIFYAQTFLIDIIARKKLFV